MEAKIWKEVSQGCSILPFLYNMFIEEATKEINETSKSGITIQREGIKCLRFCDDILLLAENREDIEKVLNDMGRLLRNAFGLKINKSRTILIISFRNENINPLNIEIGKEKVNEVVELMFLGSRITWDKQSRIAQANNNFFKNINLLLPNIGLGIKKKFRKLYVWNIALYGSETWTIDKAE